MTAADLGSAVQLDPDADAHALRIDSVPVLDAVGSRIIVVRFQCGSELREHASHLPILLRVIDGHATVTAAGERFELHANNVLHLDAGVQHEARANEASRLCVTFLTDAQAPSAKRATVKPVVKAA